MASSSGFVKCKVPSLPYKGSKAVLARLLVERMPRGSVFYDLFCGGGSVTSAALLSGKYGRVVMNDVIEGLPQFYLGCLRGEGMKRTDWVSREAFHASEKCANYERICFSFGSSARTYAYGRDLEDYKRRVHLWVVENDVGALREIGLPVPRHRSDDLFGRLKIARRWLQLNANACKQRYSPIRQRSVDTLCGVEHLERVKRLCKLFELRRFADVVEARTGSYADVAIPEADAVVYCDIPYRSTNGYDYTSKVSGFDYEGLYAWVRGCGRLVFVSEYWMPDDFVAVVEIPHSRGFSASLNGKETCEKLFVHKDWLGRYEELMASERDELDLGV